MTVISIGQQSGGGDPLKWPKVHLAMMFEKHCTRTYCPAIAEFALVLRVSGTFDDFGPEAIERLRRQRSARVITVDMVVPIPRWQGKKEAELKRYLAKRVREALEVCVARLKKDKEAVKEAALFADVDAAIAEFLSSKTPHKPWD
ncbi:hypothetical protein AYO44_15165 [Planctomycetaceae bacterium SCGC AG-212-F19]|nr:hypothetical protein AYO44_15165 [Planctomycetaceae bacterium SCGC AG-212-F19]